MTAKHPPKHYLQCWLSVCALSWWQTVCTSKCLVYYKTPCVLSDLSLNSFLLIAYPRGKLRTLSPKWFYGNFLHSILSNMLEKTLNRGSCLHSGRNFLKFWFLKQKKKKGKKHWASTSRRKNIDGVMMVLGIPEILKESWFPLKIQHLK